MRLAACAQAGIWVASAADKTKSHSIVAKLGVNCERLSRHVVWQPQHVYDKDSKERSGRMRTETESSPTGAKAVARLI